MLRFLYTCAGVLLIISLHGQMTSPTGHFDHLIQNLSANPALEVPGRLHIGIPLLHQISAEHRNNFLNPRNIFTQENGGVQIDIPRFLASIGPTALTAQQLRVDLGFVGWRTEKRYYHFRLSHRVQATSILPKELFQLAFYGNAGDFEFPNGEVDLSGLNLRGQHYSELVFGVQQSINDQFRAGVNIKYLMGWNVAQTDIERFSVITDPETFELNVLGAYSIHAGGLGNQAYNFSLTANAGWGLDLGATYEPTEDLQFQFSVMDLGWIRWNSGVDRYETQNIDFVFDGVDVTDFIFDAGIDFGTEFNNRLDSTLSQLESDVNVDAEEGSIALSTPAYMRFGAEYDLWEKGIHAGKIYGNMIAGLGNDLIPLRLSVGYIHRFGKPLQLGLHLSQQDWGPLSLGTGLVLEAGSFQCFFIMENLANLRFDRFSESASGTNYYWPVRSDDVRLQLGFNLAFAERQAKVLE